MTIESGNVKIPAADGGAFGGYFAKPEGKGPFPGILVIQEIFGINADMRAKCHELAEAGYFALCPDLFWRLEEGVELKDSNPQQLQKAFDFYNAFNEETGLSDLITALGYLQNHKDTANNKVGCIGYCLGGKLAYILACHSSVDAAVSYYGVAIETILDHSKNIKAPILLHIAENDEFVSKDAQTQIKKVLGKNPYVTLQTYPGMHHAFARIHGMHYDAASASRANAQTADFLKKNLKG